MYLYLNNLEEKNIILGLAKKKDFFWLTVKNYSNRNEKILINIEKILKNNRISLKNLKGIIVINGPGSFAGIRVALSVANTLGWFLKIPVIGLPLITKRQNQDLFIMGIEKINKIKSCSIAQPFYGKNPNISHRKNPLE
jgi:hypothetical protein